MTVEARLQFVDTNVLVYAYDRSAGEKYIKAKQLISSLSSSRKGCLSIQVLQEFYSIVTRKVAQPIASLTAEQIVADLSLWRTHTPIVEDIIQAIHLQRRYQLSFWDAMIINSANRLGCQIVWSEDLNAGQHYDQVKVRNPF